MATIVYQKNKKTGAVYVYESESYWDKEKKQPRSKRRYLGKLDPETNEVVPRVISQEPEPRKRRQPANAGSAERRGCLIRLANKSALRKT